MNDIKNFYFNGVVYWLTVAKLHKRDILFDSKTKLFEISEFRSVDIDFEQDFNLAKSRFGFLGLPKLLASV